KYKAHLIPYIKAAELFEREPTFMRSLIQHNSKILEPNNTSNIKGFKSFVTKNNTPTTTITLINSIHDCFIIEAVLFNLQLSLTQLWLSFGLSPSVSAKVKQEGIVVELSIACLPNRLSLKEVF